MEHVFVEKNLRITIDEELKFENYTLSKVNTAYTIVEQMRRSFSDLDCDTYGDVPSLSRVWTSCMVALSKRKKDFSGNVQIRAAKLVDGLSKRLDIPT